MNGQHGSPLPIHVIATMPEGTRSALTTAKRLAGQSDAHVVLLVPDLTASTIGEQLADRHRVIVGGRRRVWWPRREQRLFDRLTVEGYPVVFAHLRSVPTTAIAALLILFGVTRSVSAQSESQPTPHPPPSYEWTYGGFVDIGYQRAFNDPFNKLFRSRGTTWHLNDVELNMSGIYAKKKPTEASRWGAELLAQSGKDDAIFGFSATAPNVGGSEFWRHVGLGNMSYLAPVGRGLTVQGGIFASLIGYDSLYAKDNFNYTRPWGADFTPYLMLGVNAAYPFTDKLTATFYVVNGYWHLANANNVPSSGVQLAYKATPQVTMKETVLYGPHQSNTSLEFWRFLSDTIVEHRSERFVIAFNGHFSTEQVDDAEPFRAWWVAAQLPMRWNVSGPWTVALRPELAWDSDGRWTLAEQQVAALTSTLEYRAPYKWANTILRLEYRVDDSRGAQGGFFDDHESSPGVMALTPTQHQVIGAVIFTFDSPTQR